jgi:hypothetical protein
MYKWRGLAISSFVVGLLLIVSACDQSTSTDLETSFATVNSVTPIENAQNETMDLQVDNSDAGSTFSITLNGGLTLEGWCIEWNEPSIKGKQEGVKLYSTQGHPQWKELNYLMSVKDDIRANDPEITSRDIQVAIWELTDNPKFDVDKISEYKDIDPNIYNEGVAFFDIGKVKDIIDEVKDKVSDFINDEIPGVTIIENNGQTILIGNETAYAVKTISNGTEEVDGDYSHCFSEEIINNVSFSKWGWTNKISYGEYTFDLYAEAGQCDLGKGTKVGEVSVNYMNNGTLTVTYRITENSSYTDNPYSLIETHLYAGSDPYPKKFWRYTVAPGLYGHKANHNEVNEYTYEIDGLSGDIYFIAHAVVSGFHKYTFDH